jgi:hypothetical protein
LYKIRFFEKKYYNLCMYTYLKHPSFFFAGDFPAPAAAVDPRVAELASLRREAAAAKAADRLKAEAAVEDSGDIQFSGLVVRRFRCRGVGLGVGA